MNFYCVGVGFILGSAWAFVASWVIAYMQGREKKNRRFMLGDRQILKELKRRP